MAASDEDMAQVKHLEDTVDEIKSSLGLARAYNNAYPSREIRMAVTKLDEALLWLREHARRMAEKE